MHFAEKYNSQTLKIKSPNVVMVFSNETPMLKNMSKDRWRVFFIESDQHLNKYGMKTISTTKENGTVPQEKKRTVEEEDCLKKGICFNMYSSRDHKCYENDKQNSFMGVDPVYLWKIVSDKAVGRKQL